MEDPAGILAMVGHHQEFRSIFKGGIPCAFGVEVRFIRRNCLGIGPDHWRRCLEVVHSVEGGGGGYPRGELLESEGNPGIFPIQLSTDEIK